MQTKLAIVRGSPGGGCTRDATGVLSRPHQTRPPAYQELAPIGKTGHPGRRVSRDWHDAEVTGCRGSWPTSATASGLAAFPLLAAQVTRSSAAVAAVTAVQSLPWLLLGAGLGVLVDRTDRRRLMVIVDVIRTVIIAGLAVAILAHSAGLALIYVTAFVAGTGSALRNTAEATCVPGLVESADLDRAALSSVVPSSGCPFTCGVFAVGALDGAGRPS